MKKILPFLLLCFLPSFGALNLMTWDGSASSDFNDTANWTGTAASGSTLTAGDSCLMNSGSVAATVSANVAIGALMVNGYTGTISLQTYTLTVSGAVVNLGGATLGAGTSTLSLTGAAAQTITSQGEVWYDITINRATGTCLFADAASCHTLTASATNTQVISWTGTTMTGSGNMTLDGTGTHILGNGIMMTGASSNLHIGSTLTAPTATSCAVTFNGTTACILDDDKGTTFKSLTLGAGAVVTNSGAGITTLESNTTILTLGNNSSLTANSALYFSVLASISWASFPAAYSLKGAGEIRWTLSADGITLTMPALNYTGSGTVNILGAAACGGTVTFSGSQAFGSGNLQIQSVRAGKTITLNTANYSLNAGAIIWGGSNATATFTVNCGASVITNSSYVGSTYNLGTSNINFQTSQISCSGNWTFGSNHTITASAGQLVTFTGVGTTTSNGKAFPGDLTINSTGLVRTFADKYKVNGNLLLTAGKPVFGLFRDTVVGNYTNSLTAAADTANRQDTLFLGGNMTRSAGSHTKNENAVTKLYGTSLCNMTSSGFRLNYIHLVGTNNTKQMKCLDNDTIIRLRDSVGIINQNGFALADSILYLGDSNQVLDGNRTIWKYLMFDTYYEADAISKITSFLGSAADSLVVNSVNNIGNITENLSNSGSVKQVGKINSCDTFRLIDGYYSYTNITDTIKCKYFVDSTTDSSYFIVICSGNAIIASGAKIGAGSLLRITTAGSTMTLNGNATLKTVELPVRATINGGGTLTALTTTADGLKITLEQAKKYTVGTLTMGGVAGTLDTVTAAAVCTLSTTAGTVCSYTAFKNIYSVNSIIASTGGVDLGGNTNIVFPSTGRRRSHRGLNLGIGLFVGE